MRKYTKLFTLDGEGDCWALLSQLARHSTAEGKDRVLMAWDNGKREGLPQTDVLTPTFQGDRINHYGYYVLVDNYDHRRVEVYYDNDYALAH